MAKNKETKIYPCATEDCDGKIGETSITGLCPRCYSSVYYHSKKSKAENVARAKAYRIYGERIAFLLTDNQVKEITNKPHKVKALAVLPGKVAAYRKRTKYKVLKK